MKKLAIMQPYLFPYIGYFQLMNAVDEFVVYDNIEYTKKGWINRNRILINGRDEYISLPLKKDSDYLDVKDRFLAETWAQDRIKMLNKIKEVYRKAPQFKNVFPLIESCLMYDDRNLFGFVFHSIEQLKLFLNIKARLIVSSSIAIDHTLKAEQKVLAICKELKAEEYINPIGGMELYSKNYFYEQGIHLKFIKSGEFLYPQFSNEFIPWLSIIDVLMFNDLTFVEMSMNTGFTLN